MPGHFPGQHGATCPTAAGRFLEKLKEIETGVVRISIYIPDCSIILKASAPETIGRHSVFGGGSRSRQKVELDVSDMPGYYNFKRRRMLEHLARFVIYSTPSIYLSRPIFHASSFIPSTPFAICFFNGLLLGYQPSAYRRINLYAYIRTRIRCNLLTDCITRDRDYLIKWIGRPCPPRVVPERFHGRRWTKGRKRTEIRAFASFRKVPTFGESMPR